MLVKETAPQDQRFRLGMLGVCTACLLGGLALWGRALLSRAIEEPVQGDEISRQVSAYHEVEGQGFELPADSGGKMLGQVLPPRASLATESEGSRPRPFPGPRSIALPVEPLPLSPALVPSLPRTDRKSIRPYLVLDELLDDMVDPILPEVFAFPAGARLATEEPTSSSVSELPALAQPVPDRVPVDDVTAEASTAAATAAAMPVRRSLAPFQRLTVPDPYDHRRAMEPPTPAEDQDPHASSPQRPGR